MPLILIKILLVKLFSLSQRFLWHIILHTAGLHVQIYSIHSQEDPFYNAIALRLGKQKTREKLLKSWVTEKILLKNFKNYETGHWKVFMKTETQEILKTIRHCSKSRRSHYEILMEEFLLNFLVLRRNFLYTYWQEA